MSTITKEELLKEFNLDNLTDEELEKVSGGVSDLEQCLSFAQNSYDDCIKYRNFKCPDYYTPEDKEYYKLQMCQKFYDEYVKSCNFKFK